MTDDIFRSQDAVRPSEIETIGFIVILANALYLSTLSHPLPSSIYGIPI